MTAESVAVVKECKRATLAILAVVACNGQPSIYP
jgi:hypothetical protein